MSARPYPPEVLASLELAVGTTSGVTRVNTFSDGGMNVVLLAYDGNAYVGAPLTLGQAIQLRDFLNRHIDELALQQIGSLAVRSSDDPTRLASVEEVPVLDEEAMNRPPAWNSGHRAAPFNPDRYKKD